MLYLVFICPYYRTNSNTKSGEQLKALLNNFTIFLTVNQFERLKKWLITMFFHDKRKITHLKVVLNVK